MATGSGTHRAFDLLRSLPRLALNNLRPNPGAKKQKRVKRGTRGGHGYKRVDVVPTGYEGGNSPFHLHFKAQSWNKGHHLKLSYVPLPLEKLQYVIDLERVRTDIPIDVAQLALSGFLQELLPLEREGGYLLQDEGMDKFSAVINLEVQWVTEPIIAAIESTGSTITTAYYDPISLDALRNPTEFFKRGKPIPKRMVPPQRLMNYYIDPKNRGYLADPDAIAEERFILAQKYGYTLPDLKKSPKYDMLIMRKDPRQIFYGLEPGWIVNLPDKQILKPKCSVIKDFYTN